MLRSCTPYAVTRVRSVLVDVVPMLMMPVAVVDVIYMVAVLHRLVTVALVVGIAVIGVDVLLGVRLAVVEVIHVVAVGHCLVPVTG